MQARLRPRADVSPRIIPQSDLQRLASLRATKRRIQSEEEALRDSLIERHNAGAPVESGRLGLSVKEVEVHKLTNAELERILGPVEAEHVHAQVRPRVQTNVSIIKPR